MGKRHTPWPIEHRHCNVEIHIWRCDETERMVENKVQSRSFFKTPCSILLYCEENDGTDTADYGLTRPACRVSMDGSTRWWCTLLGPLQNQLATLSHYGAIPSSNRINARFDSRGCFLLARNAVLEGCPHDTERVGHCKSK